MNRFRADHSAGAVINAMKRSESPSLSEEKGEGKRTERTAENISELFTSRLINQEEEVFEWREVVRGKPTTRVVIKKSYLHLGLTDIQTWVTGIAYFGLLVSLYSYSLFLSVVKDSF